LLGTSGLKEGAVIAVKRVVTAGKTEPQEDITNRTLGKEGTMIHG
jgi:hypothetical protein